MATSRQASIGAVSTNRHTPAQRADAVRRAAEAAAAAAGAGTVARADPETPQPIHEAGAPARLLAAAGELETHVGQARAQLDALDEALARLEHGRQSAD
jgi:hypothetical protein